MLFGMSLIYGLTGGETRLDEIAGALGQLDPSQEAMALASILFVVVGFAFKVSAFPFQFWAPDTYEGAPVPVAAFLAVASKAAGFAGLLQLMFVAFIGQHEFWVPIFAFLAIATMTIGNLVALQQRQFVRLLAYSGIAQAGYMLLPFALVIERPGRQPAGVRLRDRLHLDLRHHEPRGVRGGGGAQQAQSEAPDLRLRGGRAGRARSSRWG